MNYYLLYLFIAATLARFVGLTQSLWLDESTTVNVAKNLTAQEILIQFSPNDFHPPLYYFFIDFWISIFGSSEVAVRTPSIIFSLIAGYFVYKTAEMLTNTRIALASTAFFLFNPLIMYYSHEVRMYMMVTMLSSIAVYFFIQLTQKKKITDNQRWTAVLGFNIAAALSFLTFYGVAFLYAAFYLFLLTKKQYKLIGMLIPGFVLAIGIIFPLLQKQFQQAQGALVFVKNWDLVLGIPTMKNLLLLPLKFTTGRVSFDPKLLYYAVGLISTVIVWYFVAKGGFRQRKLVFITIATLGIAFVFSFATPLFQYFRFLYLMPIIAILIAYGTRKLKWERYLVAGIFLFFSLLYLFVPSFHRENWKHILISVPATHQIFMVPSATDPIQYYYPQRKTQNLFEIDKKPLTLKEVYVIPYTAEVYGYDYKSIMTKSRYTLKSQEDYNGVTLEHWVRQ